MSDIFYEKMANGGSPLPMHQHTNHLPVHPEVIEAIKDEAASMRWVYYGGATGSAHVKEVIAEDLNVDLNEYDILLTNGAIESFYMIMQQFHPEWKAFVDCIPSWPWPRHFIKAYNIPVEKISMRKITPDDMTPDVCINLINGQHPQSLYYTNQELVDIAEAANKNNTWVIHDMTYRDFFPEYPNLLSQNPERGFVIFSFSKANSLAGLRIGGLVCSKENAKRFYPLNPARLGVNVIAERAVITSIKTKSLWKQNNIDYLKRNNQYIYDSLSDLEDRGVLSMPKKDVMSDVWIDFHGVSSTWVVDELRKLGVSVNNTSITAYEVWQQRGENANHITVTTSVPDYWISYFCDQMHKLFE